MGLASTTEPSEVRVQPDASPPPASIAAASRTELRNRTSLRCMMTPASTKLGAS